MVDYNYRSLLVYFPPSPPRAAPTRPSSRTSSLASTRRRTRTRSSRSSRSTTTPTLPTSPRTAVRFHSLTFYSIYNIGLSLLKWVMVLISSSQSTTSARFSAPSLSPNRRRSSRYPFHLCSTFLIPFQIMFRLINLYYSSFSPS